MDKTLIKIDPNYLVKIETTNNLVSYFGDWINDADLLKDKFINASPFEHIVIDNFLNETVANELHNAFPTNFDDWHKYENPIEVKYAYDNMTRLE